MQLSENALFDDGNLHPTQLRGLLEDLQALDEEQLANIQAIVKGLIKAKGIK